MPRNLGDLSSAIPKSLGIRRCPHCGIAHPLVIELWHSEQQTPRSDGKESRTWAVNMCVTCGSLITIAGQWGLDAIYSIDLMFPRLPDVAEDLPERAKTYLRQAHDTLASPDASTVMSSSAVDAMLKEKGYTEGTVYSRINEAKDDGVLTAAMAEWAHHVRLEGNRPRHADDDNPHVSSDEAKACLDFAEALGNFLFVITARVQRGIEKAKAAESE